MSQIIIQWIDFIWLPLAFMVVAKQHRLFAVGFVLCCILCLRLEYELLESMDMTRGFTGWIETPPYTRGLIVYAFAIMAFLLLSHFSQRTHSIIYMGAALSVFISTFVVSMLVMAL